MKQIYILALAFMVLLSMTMSVEALEQKTLYRQNGISAYADWTETTNDGLTIDTYLGVTQTDDGTDISISICSYEIAGNGSCKSGYKFTQDNVFTMDKKFDSASLNSVQIDNVYEWYCDENGCWESPAESVTIEATWAGIGDISRGSYKWMSKNGDYISKGSSSSLSREATAQGFINGNDLGISDFAGLSRFKSMNMEMNK